MLVLTRRVGERLVIGNEVTIEVLSVSGEGVRLGIVAPRETSVHRFEVFEEIQHSNRAASAVVGAEQRNAFGDLINHVRARDAGEKQ
jgi:carbon storage regulator